MALVSLPLCETKGCVFWVLISAPGRCAMPVRRGMMSSLAMRLIQSFWRICHCSMRAGLLWPFPNITPGSPTTIHVKDYYPPRVTLGIKARLLWLIVVLDVDRRG